MTTDDPVIAALARLNPTVADPPPPRGSTRHDEILERAMHTTQPATGAEAGAQAAREANGADLPDEASAIPPAAKTTSVVRRLALAGVAAIVVGLVSLVVVLIEPDRPMTPVAAITAAAGKTGNVTTLRVRATYDSGDGYPTRTEGEINGRDYQTRFTQANAETGEVSTSTRTVIGNRRWDTSDGKTTSTIITPEEGNAPYPQASEAVVKAALRGSTVTDLGKEDVAGVETTHYKIELGPTGTRALQELSPSELARFELEYPEGVVSLDVWVVDDLIRRIRIRSEFEAPSSPGSTIEFYDFGADITIEPPS